MKDDEHDVSRRKFIQLAAVGAGALTASSVCPSEAQATGSADTPGGSRSKFGAGSATAPGNLPSKEAHQSLSLNGVWSVIALPLDAEGDVGYQAFLRTNGERLTAQVPGEIHLDLMRAGRMEDPAISDNARARCRWPEAHSWWYRSEFSVTSDFRKHQRQRLIFDGIDLYGQVFVNGQLAGSTQNAFVPASFDVKHLIVDGVNELVVRVTSGMELTPWPSSLLPRPGDKKLALYANRAIVPAEPRILRKPMSAAWGMDWCDPLPNSGIWRGVRLEGRSHAVIHQLRLDTVIRGQDVSLEGEIAVENLHPWSELACMIELNLRPPQREPIVKHFAIGAQAGLSRIPCRVLIPHAQLWWPNGMGAQPLYELTVRILSGGQETDRQMQRLGLRTIELDRSPLPEGSRFGFKVNGEKVYCKGGNWVPADLIPARVDAARYEKLVAEARDAHFTMLRVWGGGIYESEAFYDACDRAGILVWQDFAFSLALYPDRDPAFMTMVRDEAEAVVRRLRHHPSLALWCGNNEIAMIKGLGKCDPASPADCVGFRIFNELLPEICRANDPVRAYWPSSPLGGAEPNSQTSGDTHGWTIGTAGPAGEPSNQVADQFRGRFISEYGVLGPPHLASMQEYLKAGELSFDSPAWKIHTNLFDVYHDGYISTSILNNYGDPKGLSLKQYILYGQMSQALVHGRALEATRFRKNDPDAECGGSLIWMFNDAWGEIGWSIVDHYLRRKPSYYWFRRSAAPVKVLVRSRDGQLVTRVVNDTRKKYRAAVHCGWMRLDGSGIELQKHSVNIPSNGMIEVARTRWPSSSERNPREWLYAATLTGEGIPQDQAIWLMQPHRELALAKPSISMTVQSGVLEVSSPAYCHGVHLEDEGREVLGDNYIDLLPGIPRRIPVIQPTPLGQYPLTAIMPIGL